MATVKGDVHDIGKNIVGVVLQCNNYDVVDLGVMVPAAEDPRRGAEPRRPTSSGSPASSRRASTRWSRFASEMERQGFEIPLLIGGATTSRAHTAVKVDQKYHGPVVWVKDASRSVPVVSQLLSDEQRPKLLATVKTDYDALRARHAAKTTERPLVVARARPRQRHPVDWSRYRPPVPHLVAQQEKELLQRPVRVRRHDGHPVRPDVEGLLARPSCATTSTGGRSSSPGR